jgi:RNA polymerase sigma factor (sigma-70 family)
MQQQITKLSPKLTLGQRALLQTPEAQAVVRDAVRWAAIHLTWADRDEARALAHEALVLRVRGYEPSKGSFASYAGAFVRGHMLRQLLKERAAVPRIDALLRVLARGRSEHRSSKDRLEEATTSREEVRRRTKKRLTRMVVEMFAEAARIEDRSPETLLIAHQERARLDRAVAQASAALPDELAQVMRLRQEDKTVAEIAASLGCSPRTAARRLAAAIVQLEHALRAAGVSLPYDD